jgi:hypothetical protein
MNVMNDRNADTLVNKVVKFLCGIKTCFVVVLNGQAGLDGIGKLFKVTTEVVAGFLFT